MRVRLLVASRDSSKQLERAVNEGLDHAQGPLGLVHGRAVAGVAHQHQLESTIALHVPGQFSLSRVLSPKERERERISCV